MENNDTLEILDHIPDFSNWEKACRWIEEGKKSSSEISKDANFAYFDWGDIAEKQDTPFGLYQSKNWRKFVLATFLADLISYSTPVDQVSFDRLLFVMHNFPQGFRTWWVPSDKGAWWPVGYTGWYPMYENVFDIFEKTPETLKNRMVVPNTFSDANPFLYLFNYSVATSLKKSALSRELVKKYVQEINDQKASGLACITVSDDGVNVANKFGMKLTGHLNIDGSLEGIYTYRSI